MAGIDLICIGNPSFPEPYDAEQRLDEVVMAVVAAVDEGRLPIGRLEEAIDRVSALTAWLAAQEPALATGHDSGLGRDVARRALQVHGDVALRTRSMTILELAEGFGVAAGRRGREVGVALTRRDPSSIQVEVDSPEAVRAALVGANAREVVVLARLPRDEHSVRLLEETLAQRPDAVVVYLGLSDADAPGDRVICTHGGGRAVGEAVADLMMERLTEPVR